MEQKGNSENEVDNWLYYVFFYFNAEPQKYTKINATIRKQFFYSHDKYFQRYLLVSCS